jgi:putative transposon-encoded protein
MEYYDILLLREINAKPFEFVGEVFSAGSAGSAYIEVPDKYLGKKFRLIEVI